MSCDYARVRWWRHLEREFDRQLPKHIRDMWLAKLPDAIEEHMKKARKGGTGPRRSHRRKDASDTGYRNGKPDGRKKTAATEQPAERLYSAVKQAALDAERDWTTNERAEIRQKYLALKALINAVDDDGKPINPAHGKEGAVPRISSQVAYAAVYDAVMAATQEAGTQSDVERHSPSSGLRGSGAISTISSSSNHP